MISITTAVLLTALADAGQQACMSQSLGKGVTIAEPTPVAAILDQPDTYVGRAVRIEGTVKDVCEMAGCWLELEAGNPEVAGRTLRVKVNDGEIVFPKTSRGQRAVAEGVVEAKEVSRDAYESHLRHIADEQGRDFDPSSVGDGPYRLLQVKGTGAEVCR